MSAFERISNRISPAERKYAAKTLDLVERIRTIMQDKGMKQKDLAKALGKSPSEVSKWLTGLHNFGLKTLIKIEEALDADLFLVLPKTESPKMEKRKKLLEMVENLPNEHLESALDFVSFLGTKETGKPLAKKYEPNELAVFQEPQGKYEKNT